MKVEEYTELDFEHVILETPKGQTHCEACGAEHRILNAGIWSCTVCYSFNMKELEA